MRKFGMAVLAVASIAGASAQSATAAEVPGPCEQVNETFETANIQMEPTPEPTGTIVRAVCERTG